MTSTTRGAPRCGDGHRPSSLSIDSGGHTLGSLPATRRPRFRVDHAGVTSLFADAAANGDASYTACFVFGR